MRIIHPEATAAREPLPQRPISLRALAWLCAAALLLSLAPLYGLSYFNHACYDDFGFTVRTHAVWRSTGSLGATVAEAARAVRDIRQSWQGVYAATFLNALQPAVFGEGLYWLTTALLLTGFLFSVWFFLRQALRRVLGADRRAVWIVFCLAAFVLVQLVPSVSEAFFWFNGGVAYTLMWSAMLTRVGCWLAFERSTRPAARAAWLALLAALTVVVGGGNYPTLLFACALDALLWGRSLFVRKRDRVAEGALLALLLACLAFSASAPGNAIRAATLSGGMSAPKAVAQALYFGVALMGNWFSLPVLALWLSAAWLLRDALRRSGCAFRWPALVTLLGACLFCVQLAPTLFTGNYLGDGRARDTYFYTYVLLGGGLALYWAGWWLRRRDARRAAMADGAATASDPAKLADQLSSAPAASPTVRLGAACAAIVLLAVGCLGYKPEGTVYYGPQNLSAGLALTALASGQAQAYDAAMDERDRLLNDASAPDVELAAVSDVPAAFMGDVSVGDRMDYVQTLYAEYYGKQSVRFRLPDAQ